MKNKSFALLALYEMNTHGMWIPITKVNNAKSVSISCIVITVLLYEGHKANYNNSCLHDNYGKNYYNVVVSTQTQYFLTSKLITICILVQNKVLSYRHNSPAVSRYSQKII